LIFLKDSAFRPHKSQYWLNQKHDEGREQRIQELCELYQNAVGLERLGEKVLSCDEKTGIQALEHSVAKRTCQPGMVERLEQNYQRHGTQCLIANFNVATGKVVQPSVLDTRTENDFLEHIKQTVASDASVKRWHFVLDQLNTHQSESLVCFVAERDGLDLDLGVKGKSGILGSKVSRAAFLSDSTHSVVFHYTPLHSSWMNQVEVWFSIFVRKFWKRSSFKSTQELKAGILGFITYFNETMGKAFEWKFKGFKRDRL
jgi:DDE superfamily endonuclease